MTIYDNNILQNIPFLSHFKASEIESLHSIAERKQILNGDKIDIKKTKSFGVIMDGMFELEQRNKGETVYIAPGSFFGEIPFTNVSYSGTIKAVKNSTIMLINPEEMYRVFLASYKGLKGYIRNIQKNGFDIIDSGNDFLKCKSRVITVFSHHHNSGTSILAAMLALMLSKHGTTLIMDASYNANSIFHIFEKDLPSALSQKGEGNTSSDKFINDRIVDAGENLSMLNISSGSRVRINPDILSPVIFILSRRYRYIIIDHSHIEKNFTDIILGLSDVIFPVVKNIKDRAAFYNTLDSSLKDGQRVYYILNRFYAKNIGTFEGGYILENLEIRKNENIFLNLKRHIESDSRPKIFDDLTGLVTSGRTALVAQTNLSDSVFLAGFFSSIYERDIRIDITYASSWSYLIAALFNLSEDQAEFDNNFLKLFSEDRINSFLEITFPEEHVYKNGRIFHYASELAGENRLEHYNMLPMALLTERESCSSRIFSTGYVRDLFTASFLLDIFEPKTIAGCNYYSGFPANYVKTEDLLRTDVDEIRCVFINNKQKLRFGEKKLSGFYKGYIDGLINKYNHGASSKSAEDFYIDVDVGKYNLKEILKISKEICKAIKM